MGFFDSGIADGLNQTTGHMVNMGMQLYQHKAQQAIQQERLRVEQETATRRNKLLDMQIAQQEKETELIPIETQLTKLGFTSPEEHQLFMSKIPLDIEEVAGTKYVQRKKGVEHFTKLAADPEFNIDLGTIRTKNIDKALAQLSNPETIAKLKPEELQKVEEQKAALIEQKTMLANKMKIEQLKIKGGRLINVPQGTKTIDPVTGETIADNPKEEEGLVVVGHDVLDKKTRKRVYRAPFAPSNATRPKITANVALNPINGQNEYLMTDGSFSGKVAGAKPKSVSGADIGRLQKAVNDAGDNPSPADQIAINEEAQRLGYTYENIQETKPGIFWGTNTTSTWRLVPQKQPQATSTPQTTSAYKTADDVKSAFEAGKIKEAEAVKILKDKFGMK